LTVDEQWGIISQKIKNAGIRKRKPLWMNDKVLSRIKRNESAFDLYKQSRGQRQLGI